MWWVISFICFLLLSVGAEHHRLPIIFVYTVVDAVCEFGLPKYIRVSLEQTVFTQPDCDVYLLSNIGECKKIAESTSNIPGVHVIDSKTLESMRTADFRNLSRSMFSSDNKNELWMTSALRFFMLEDVMEKYNWTEFMHVEADNLVYGRYSTLLPVLRKHFPLAVTPLNAQKSFLTASVFWVDSRKSLEDFNNYLLALGRNSGDFWTKYLAFMRVYGCCKAGGIAPDKNGQGIKPFAINEMSMLAYYHDQFPANLKLLPVVPAHPYLLNRYVINMSSFSPMGKEIPAPTGHGVWDPNSWGQLIGGTSVKRGRDVGFTDATHIAGQAIRMNQCLVQMLCANMTEYGWMDGIDLKPHEATARCYTAPFVKCAVSSQEGYVAPWTPLWNLHVHSKHTAKFRSHLCDCKGGMEQDHRPGVPDVPHD